MFLGWVPLLLLEVLPINQEGYFVIVQLMLSPNLKYKGGIIMTPV